MTNDEMNAYIGSVSWDDVKDLSHVNRRVYFNEELEIKDEELENSSYLYLTLFSEPCENSEDRYFGSDTEFKTKSFMQTDYLGSPVTKVELYNQAIADANKDHRIICLRVDSDETNIVEAEADILDGVDAKRNVRFFNESNISGGRFRTLAKQDDLFDYITSNIEKANNGKKCAFETGEDTVENLSALPRAQPRHYDLDQSHVSSIAKDIKGDPKVAKTIRHTILLEDGSEPGGRKRGGNSHTIEACNKPGVKKYVKKLNYIIIPRSLLNLCSKNTLRDILRWDNKKEEQISRKTTPIEEIVESCFEYMQDYKIKNHTHKRVKRRAKDLGALDSEWAKIRGELRERTATVASQTHLPPNMELIHYTAAKISKIEKAGTDDKHETKCLSSVYSGNTFNGWDFLIRWVKDKKNKNRTLHTLIYHGEKSHKKYADLWPKRQGDIISIIGELFRVFGKEGHFTYDVLPRFEGKKNPVHDKKAA